MSDDCPGCAVGDHTRHNPTPWPGCGKCGTQKRCECRGDCFGRFIARHRRPVSGVAGNPDA